jgi:two-component system phosphate regulon response regulator PhoB
MEHPGWGFLRDQLIDSVRGHGIFIDSRTVNVHIRRLRKVLNADGEQDVIRTVRSAGYALDAAATTA